MKFYVSRQRYYGVDEDEGTIVEVAAGGSDYANPDQLGCKWRNLGEGRTFEDPMEACECAIQICEAWRASGEKNAKVGMGSTGGFTLPFDGQDYDTLRQRAQAWHDKLPKCDMCGELLGEKTWRSPEDWDDSRFCREYCAEKHWRQCQEMCDDNS
jgi:hypothetical protein